ncbi:hypothetical protein LAZ67_21001489 [Cordylochernes scorpioides]|uniref:Uncharacterized protein n=1 Tax=Cordylochernes scorpioides TaxID=51811 RepID=A0ABY6LRX1_9ARAC|nr:hypothetical protein LAZ67_21001489 [Cordylochernes scorpioides]
MKDSSYSTRVPWPQMATRGCGKVKQLRLHRQLHKSQLILKPQAGQEIDPTEGKIDLLNKCHIPGKLDAKTKAPSIDVSRKVRIHLRATRKPKKIHIWEHRGCTVRFDLSMDKTPPPENFGRTLAYIERTKKDDIRIQRENQEGDIRAIERTKKGDIDASREPRKNKGHIERTKKGTKGTSGN